jgi:hypothetical protein
MSCPHGNHPDACDICDEVAAAYNSGVEHTEREWVGLTDEDMGCLFPHGTSVWVQETVKIIEAKLKEKNT